MRLAGWTLACCATLLVPALVAGAAGPKAGEKRICVPSADGKAWDCGTPDNPPAERGLPVPVEAGTGAAPPLFLAAPPSDPGRNYVVPEPAPAPPPLPDEFPTVQRGLAPAPTPGPAPAPAPEPVATSPTPAAAETAPVEADAGYIAAAEAAPTEPPVEAAEVSQPPPFLAAPAQRRAFPLAPVVAPVESAREQAIASSESEASTGSGSTGKGQVSSVAETTAAPVTDPAPPAGVPVESVASVDGAEPMSMAPAPDAAPAPVQVVPAAAPEPEPAQVPDAPDLATEAPAPSPEVQDTDTGAITAPAPESAAAQPSAAAPEMPEPALEQIPIGAAAAVPGPTPAEPSDITEPASTVAGMQTPVDEGAEVSLTLHQATAFLRLPASAWTVQLARGGREILASVPLRDGRQVDTPVYAVAVGDASARQWLLLWASFPDADAARRALRDQRLTGVPRRVGPLQVEVRTAGTQLFPGGAGGDAVIGARVTGASGNETMRAGPAGAGSLAVPALPAARFEALPASAWTVQLARAASSAGFDALLTRSGLSPADCHVVAIDSGGARTWLLLWSKFADADAARAAARTLRGAPGAFVRRIGPLQSEARRAR